jgi:glyoxalase family protein
LISRLYARTANLVGLLLRFKGGKKLDDFSGASVIWLQTRDHGGRQPRTISPAPADRDAAPAIGGFGGVTVCVEAPERTVELLTETFGYRQVAEDAGRRRLRAANAADGTIGAELDVVCHPEAIHGRLGGGSVHHIAFRAQTDEEQRVWREKIAALGFNVTPVLDRQYFRSIYFREPGGILFEIATDPPGFAVDEQPDRLGTSLKLPPWLEPRRADLERRLPPVRLPGAGS